MSLKESARARLRRNRAWVTLRRAQREGFVNALRRYRLWTKILRTPPVSTDEVREGAAVEVHVLCYERDYLCALWALKSFYRFAGVRFPLVVHVQGRASRLMKGRLKKHLPSARVVLQEEADAGVEAWLAARGLTRLVEARRRNPFMLKLTDFALTCRAVNLLTLDSDILFFRRPSELLAAADTDAPVELTLFQRDPASAYNITEERAREELGVALAPRVNTGITLSARGALDLARCEEFLAHADVARPTGWTEQTLHALAASERGRVEFLPESYLVSLAPHADVRSLVARHYAGPSRALLTTEGMRALERAGFLCEAEADREGAEVVGQLKEGC